MEGGGLLIEQSDGMMERCRVTAVTEMHDSAHLVHMVRLTEPQGNKGT